MRRREFIAGLAGTAAAWPLAARAQQAMSVIGFLHVGPVTRNLAGLRKGLDEMGYAEGRNLAIEFRDTEQYDRLPALAAELVRRRVAVIFTASSFNVAQAAKVATTTIPIVFTLGEDPVETGLVASLNRPGGNLTGVTYLSAEILPKRLELLRQLLPPATTIAFLVNSTSSTADTKIRTAQAAARSIGQQLIILSASTASEIDAAFASLVEQRAGGLLIDGDSFFFSRHDQLVALAARHRIPSVYSASLYATAGGLMSYSNDRVESWRQAGLYIGRILKGEKPADLPIIQPSKFEFVINVKTAKALGLTIPETLLATADEVIQ
jgi:putative tryptophan/tyrosine transport system substrate-binding protein